MLLTERDQESTQFQALTLESPFAMSEHEDPLAARGFAPGEAAFMPFAPDPEAEYEEGELDLRLSEALAELRDEAFDEALSFLAEETESAVADRFADEAAGNGPERARVAELHLSPVQYEAEHYLAALESGLQGLDLESLDEAQLEDKLAQFDPQSGNLSPAGEEFVGKLVRKAKKAVKFVVKAAKSAAKIAMPFLGPVLDRLKKLVRPLLKRVLALAIGRLPAPLRPAAKMLAGKLGFEAEAADGEATMSPANLSDVEALSEEFDNALAEAVLGEGSPAFEGEDESDEAHEDGRQLERLAEARGTLIDALASGDEARVAPAVEQFVPVLLGALRLGITLVGRPKVVRFLAGYLAKLVGKWVPPQMAAPLSNAIVDTGLRLISLEAEDEADARGGEAAPVALASVIEDTVRRLAEAEEYIFEDEGLTQLAVADSFGEAVGTHFPPRFVRPALRQAAALGGAFVARRPRQARSYAKYSRAPEIEITAQVADAIPTFGGTTLGQALRAAGVGLPLRARIHLYQARPGSTVSAILRHDRSLGRSAQMLPRSATFHPLTPAAAGVLLREPRLGVRTPPAFLRSAARLGAGQRIFALQPVGAAAPIGAGATPSALRAAAGRQAPSRTALAFDRKRGRLALALYFSEEEAQRIAQGIRQGQGHAALLRGLSDAWRRADGSAALVPLGNEDAEESEEFAARGSRLGGRLRRALLRHLRRWALPALATWARSNGEAFTRAAADPASGLTVRLRIGPVPDPFNPAAWRKALGGGAAPSVAIGIAAGRQRP